MGISHQVLSSGTFTSWLLGMNPVSFLKLSKSLYCASAFEGYFNYIKNVGLIGSFFLLYLRVVCICACAWAPSLVPWIVFRVCSLSVGYCFHAAGSLGCCTPCYLSIPESALGCAGALYVWGLPGFSPTTSHTAGTCASCDRHKSPHCGLLGSFGAWGAPSSTLSAREEGTSHS